MNIEAFDREHQLAPATLEEEASDAFVRRLNGDWTADDQLALESRLQRDPSYRDAFRRVEESWGLLDELAETPVGLKYREEAASVVRQMSTTRRLTSRLSAGEHWRLAAAFVGVALLGITVWQLSSHGYPPTQHGLSQQGQNQYAEYRTRIGEQRTVELSDHSQIMLDAATRIRVRLSGDARLVQLDAGQAEFHVVKDIARPFRVQVDGDTITDLGTVFNVNRTEGGADIAVIEGRVSVDRGRTSADAGTVPQQKQGPIQLSAGEELSVNRNGPMYLNQHADLASLSAWRQGLVIIRNEPLSQAVRRFNRYSTVQIEIQGNGLAAERIGGVFKAGDTQGFIRAIGLYQPVTADYSRNGTVLLKPAPATPQ